MKKLGYTLLALSTVAIIHCGGGSKFSDNSINTGKPIVKINGDSINEGYIEFLGEINPRAKAQLSNPMARKQLLDNLVEQELLYQEALKKGYDKNKDVAAKLALYSKIIVAQAVLEEEIKEEAKKQYDAKKDSDFTKVQVSQIQINFPKEEKSKNKKDKKADKEELSKADKEATLKKAKEIREKLVNGADFAELAKEVSDDKLSKRKGGDLGEVAKNDKRLERRKLSTVAEAAFKLKKGEISQPIESEKGYHIIKVTSEPTVTPFEEAERVLRFEIQRDIKDKVMAKLKADAKIEYLDESLKNAPAPGNIPPPGHTRPASPMPGKGPQKDGKAPAAQPQKAPQKVDPHAGHDH